MTPEEIMVRAHYKDVCAFENGDFDDLGPNAQNSYRRRIAVILTALSTAGFVVVPREPTEAMLFAAWPNTQLLSSKVYKAMLSAYEESK